MKTEFIDEGSAMEEWQRRELAVAHREWCGFWRGLLIALFISGTAVAVGVWVWVASRI